MGTLKCQFLGYKIIIVLILQKIIKMVLKITGFRPFSLTSYLPFSYSKIQMFVPHFSTIFKRTHQYYLLIFCVSMISKNKLKFAVFLHTTLLKRPKLHLKSEIKK